MLHILALHFIQGRQMNSSQILKSVPRQDVMRQESDAIQDKNRKRQERDRKGTRQDSRARQDDTRESQDRDKTRERSKTLVY